ERLGVRAIVGIRGQGDAGDRRGQLRRPRAAGGQGQGGGQRVGAAALGHVGRARQGHRGRVVVGDIDRARAGGAHRRIAGGRRQRGGERLGALDEAVIGRRHRQRYGGAARGPRGERLAVRAEVGVRGQGDAGDCRGQGGRARAPGIQGQGGGQR